MPKPISLPLIEKLVGFDTTSRESNLELIGYVQEYLKGFGIDSLLVENDEGSKANLFATLGDKDKPGIMLSGHTDVVPVDGQTWDTNPFRLTAKDGKLYGRGTADMKSFIAIVLAFVPRFLKKGLKTPVHLAFSYDEEIGCIGVRRLIEKLKGFAVRPAICIVGEPTSMQVVTGHKGKRSFVARVRGHEAHSALAPHGVNAIEYAAEFIGHLKSLATRKQKHGPFDPLYDVTHTTVHTGTIAGGTQLNIVPKSCRVEFEFRYLADDDPDALEAGIRAYAKEKIEPRMRAVAPETGIDIERVNEMPGLDTDPNAEVVAFVKALAGRNDHAKVAFGTEAGLFTSRVDIPTVVCGPGAIAQAHKPNEFITLEQVAKGEEFMKRLMEKVCGR